ncbi:hypothetical protein P692DRAFT_20706409, partial [Suillus brevipes Sb2]
SFRLFHYNVHSAALLRICTALEEMILHCVPTRVPLASDLPPTIEHFAFGEYRGLLQLVFETVDVLPRLGVLTCGSYQRIIM